MKRKSPIFLILVLIALLAEGQPNKMKANDYYSKYDYCKALKYFKISIDTEVMDNYSYYCAAQSACQCGTQEEAIDYYQKGFEIAFDYDSYEYFAFDTLNQCFNQTEAWLNILERMKFQRDSANSARQQYIDIRSSYPYVMRQGIPIEERYWNQYSTPEDLIHAIQKFDEYQESSVSDVWVIYYLTSRNGTKIPFHLYIPKNYTPTKSYPLYVYLHGAAVYRPEFISKYGDAFEHSENSIFEKLKRENLLILYPVAHRHMNWVYHQEAFENILKQISQVKSLYHIDDDRVYVNGHSNGGTGAFWLALNRASSFAGFGALSMNPISYIGNTHFRNLQNSFKVFTAMGKRDEVFDSQKVGILYQQIQRQKLNWKHHWIEGDHAVPYTNKGSIDFVVDSLLRTKRDRNPSKIVWETDAEKNGRHLYIEINKMDVALPKASWHRPLLQHFSKIDERNPVSGLLANPAAAIIVEVHNNIVHVKTSRVQEFTFYVTLENVDINKNIEIWVNDARVFNKKVHIDRRILLEEFLHTFDKSFLILNKIHIEVPR